MITSIQHAPIRFGGLFSGDGDSAFNGRPPGSSAKHSQAGHQDNTYRHNQGGQFGSYKDTPSPKDASSGGDPHVHNGIFHFDWKGRDGASYNYISHPGAQLNVQITHRLGRSWIGAISFITDDRRVVYDFKKVPHILERGEKQPGSKMKNGQIYDLAPGIVAQWKDGHLRIETPAIELDLRRFKGLGSVLPVLSETSAANVKDESTLFHGIWGQVMNGTTTGNRIQRYGVEGLHSGHQGRNENGGQVLEMRTSDGKRVMSGRHDDPTPFYETPFLELPTDTFSTFALGTNDTTGNSPEGIWDKSQTSKDPDGDIKGRRYALAVFA